MGRSGAAVPPCDSGWRSGPRPPGLDEAHQTNAEDRPAREEQQEINGAHVRGRALGGDEPDDQRKGENGGVAAGEWGHGGSGS